MKKNWPSEINRRDFLKLSGLALGGAALSSKLYPEELVFSEPLPSEDVDKEIESCCQFCQVRCTTRVQVKDDRVVNVYGNPDNFWTGGAMCPKGKSMVELTYSPHRIIYPLVKNGNEWKRITYKEALDIVADRISRVKKEYPEDFAHRVALFEPLWESRESELAAKATMHLAGFPDLCAPGDGCIGNSATALRLCLGSGNSPTTLDEILNSESVILFGANIAEIYPIYVRWLDMARKTGVKLIYLDPRTTPTTSFSDVHIKPRPGTDGALALGIIRHLIKAGSYDKEFVTAHVNGFDELIKDTEKYTLLNVSNITWIPVEKILQLAENFISGKRTLVWLGGSLSRYTNSIQTIRAIIALQAITGNLSGPGRGIMNVQGGKPGGAEHFEETYRVPNLDHDLNFRKVLYNMKNKKVDVLLLNSSYRRYPDANRVRKSIANVPFVIYRGFFMDDEARLSDLIIPGSMVFESEGSQYGAQRQVVWRNRAIARPGETVEDWRFYADLGKKICGDRYPDVNSAKDIFELARKDSESWRGISIERLKKSATGITWPSTKESDPDRGRPLFTGSLFDTPDGKVELRTPALGPLKWTAPKGSPKKDKKGEIEFPLIFTQGKVTWHWQHTYTNFSSFIGAFSEGNFVLIHPETAGLLDIGNGESAYLETEVGRITVKTKITEAILPGVVWTPSHPAPASPVTGNKGSSINTIVPYYWDKVSAQYNGFGCRLIKI